MVEDHITPARIRFGSRVRQLRQQQKLTLHELAARTAVTEPAIVAVEQGRRAVGDSLANRLATAFRLEGDALANFLFASAATRIVGRLIGPAVHLPPEIVHYVPQRLESEGIGVQSIREVELTDRMSGSTSPLNAADMKLATGQWRRELDSVRNAVGSGEPAPHPFLHLTLNNGERLMGILLLARI